MLGQRCQLPGSEGPEALAGMSGSLSVPSSLTVHHQGTGPTLIPQVYKVPADMVQGLQWAQQAWCQVMLRPSPSRPLPSLFPLRLPPAITRGRATPAGSAWGASHL